MVGGLGVSVSICGCDGAETVGTEDGGGLWMLGGDCTFVDWCGGGTSGGGGGSGVEIVGRPREWERSMTGWEEGAALDNSVTWGRLGLSRWDLRRVVRRFVPGVGGTSEEPYRDDDLVLELGLSGSV